MPTNLLDCYDHGPASELFVVEGVSALHAIDQVRARTTQAVFAMQGKAPNANRQSPAKILAHVQCQALFEVLGCGTGAECQPSRLRYGRIRLIADGDTDGRHATSLLLALFNHYLTPLIIAGYLGVITAPRYRVEGSGEASSYLWTPEEKQQYLADQTESDTSTLVFFKGVASLSHDERHALLVDPRTRQESIVVAD